MFKKTHLISTLFIFSLTVTASAVWYVNSPIITIAEKKTEVILKKPIYISRVGKYVVVHLDTMTITLKSGTTTLEELPILSQGKPRSYYETIGGSYISNYKKDLHFSSIGQVFMPYSVHVFGNYFIHGVPYYPDGTKVSSSYSGGCVRLADEDAKKVYDFVTRGTPIILTRGGEDDFTRMEKKEVTATSSEMTNLMVGIISLELLTQDNAITDTDGKNMTTRKELLPRLLSKKDTRVSSLFASSLLDGDFLNAMNLKAQSLGMTNTVFLDVTSPVATTEEDTARFISYISTYKRYLVLDASSTEK